MDFLAWIALAGGLLLAIACSSAYLQKMPVTSAGMYLALGLAIGPAGLGVIEIDFIKERVVLEHLTEIAVIISLFIGGLKLRLPLRDPAWKAAFRLAGPLMLICIAGVAVFAHQVLGLNWPLAFLLGAILAPTDPVLAGMVSVNHAGDHDRMRYGLSGEAGFNDGAAFPFVIFALTWLSDAAVGDWAGGWALQRIVWAVPAGLLLGYWLGKGVGRLAIYLRSRCPSDGAPGDFLALALIALAYSGAEAIGAWGFLAVFAAGLGIRQAEVRITKEHPVADESDHPPAEAFAEHVLPGEASSHPTRAAGQMVAEILTFGDTVERLLEMLMVLLIGICLANYWDMRSLAIAAVLFFMIRPLATWLVLAKTPTRPRQRLLMGWFGIRGIGSLYYLAYALNHGLVDGASTLVGITLGTVALSVLIHGSSSPLLADEH